MRDGPDLHQNEQQRRSGCGNSELVRCSCERSAGLLQPLQSVRANVYRMREGLSPRQNFKFHHEHTSIS